MAVYVRAKEMLFTLKFPMDSLEDVADSVHLMMAKSEIIRIPLGNDSTELINFGGLTHVSISSISREEMMSDSGPSLSQKIELVASLGTDGDLSIAEQAEQFLKEEDDPK